MQKLSRQALGTWLATRNARRIFKLQCHTCEAATAQPAAKECAWGQDCSAPWEEDMTSEKESTAEATTMGEDMPQTNQRERKGMNSKKVLTTEAANSGEMLNALLHSNRKM